MNHCAEIQRQLREDRALDERVRPHLDDCVACAAMAAVASRLPSPEHPSTVQVVADWSAVADAMTADRGTAALAARQPTTIRMAVAMAVALVVPVLVLLFAPRVDLDAYPNVRLALELGGPTLLGMWNAALVLRPLHRPLSGRTRAIGLAAGVLAAVVIASLPAAHHDHAASLAGGGDDFVPRAIGCLMYASMMALPVVLVLLLFSRERRSAPRATLLAVSAGLVGFAAVYAHCPIVLSVHLWAGHVAVFLPLAAFAAWLGRWRPRGR